MRISIIVSIFSLFFQLKLGLAFNNINAFTSPVASTQLCAGDTLLITWENPCGSLVTLNLAKGDPCNLIISTCVAKDVPNTGQIMWTVPNTLEPGRYSMMIIPDNNHGGINYSAFFRILQSDNDNQIPPAATSVDTSTVISCNPTATIVKQVDPITITSSEYLCDCYHTELCDYCDDVDSSVQTCAAEPKCPEWAPKSTINGKSRPHGLCICPKHKLRQGKNNKNTKCCNNPACANTVPLKNAGKAAICTATRIDPDCNEKKGWFFKKFNH